MCSFQENLNLYVAVMAKGWGVGFFFLWGGRNQKFVSTEIENNFQILLLLLDFFLLLSGLELANSCLLLYFAFVGNPGEFVGITHLINACDMCIKAYIH